MLANTLIQSKSDEQWKVSLWPRDVLPTQPLHGGTGRIMRQWAPTNSVHNDSRVMVLSPSFMTYVHSIYDRVRTTEEAKLTEISAPRTYPSCATEHNSVVYAVFLAIHMCERVELYGRHMP